MRRWFIGPVVSLLLAAAVVVGVDAPRASADNIEFAVHNRSNMLITELYVAQAGTTVWDWTRLVLVADTLHVGDDDDVNFSGYRGDEGLCLYDFKAVTHDVQEGYLFKVNLCQTSNVTFRGSEAFGV
ncbi:MAG: hypothetical protein HW416_1273 [Chloroflexi bacterium]|nr:hypothetical protein [Chloroflexota bacterium]